MGGIKSSQTYMRGSRGGGCLKSLCEACTERASGAKYTSMARGYRFLDFAVIAAFFYLFFQTKHMS